MDELGTRHVPWERIEVTWANNRPHHERPATPVIGERVWYRHDEWSPDVILVTVLDVQPADDMDDPNLWRIIRDAYGQPILDAGVPRRAPHPDPWPEIMFRRAEGSDRLTCAREARLRGSAGWLPLDWHTRPERRRLPAQTLLVPRPALALANVPLLG